MNNLSLANRLKARLTRAERLTNATALLQRMLANRTASEAPFTPGTSADAPGRGAPKAFGTDFSKEALDWTKGTAQPAMPEALRDFLDRIGREYATVTSVGTDPATTLRALVHVAFGALATDRAAVAVMLNEYNVLVQYPRFRFLRDAVEATERLWVEVLDAGMRAGDFRTGVPADAVYRFLRDAIWVSVRWYRPDGPQRPDDVAEEYLTVLLSGLATSTTTGRTR